MRPERYTYPRYLRSKRTVDDRALNRGVTEAALGSLPTDRPSRVVELGGGVGTMVDQLVENGSLARSLALVGISEEQATPGADQMHDATVDVFAKDGEIQHVRLEVGNDSTTTGNTTPLVECSFGGSGRLGCAPRLTAGRQDPDGSVPISATSVGATT